MGEILVFKHEPCHLLYVLKHVIPRNCVTATPSGSLSTMKRVTRLRTSLFMWAISENAAAQIHHHR